MALLDQLIAAAGTVPLNLIEKVGASVLGKVSNTLAAGKVC